MKTLLKGGRVIDPATGLDEVRDILIDDEQIEAIGQNLDATGADRVVALTADHWVVPGLVDVHVHFRDPGRPDKETTATGSAAAIMGGFTSVCVMPNTDPVLDNLPTLQYVLDKAEAEAKARIYPIAAISKGLEGKELTEMGMLHQQGVVGFSDDGMCLMNANLMRLALEYSRMYDVPIICHAEDGCLSGKGCMNEGYYSTMLGLPGIPNTSESVIVARDIELARMTGGHVHFAHVSTRESVALIRAAKKEGLRVTAEVTPHHLVFTDAAIQDYDPDFKMNPPLRAEADREALIAALQDGTFDAIATDHAPHTPDEKRMEFDKSPNGVVGLETSLAVMLTRFVHTGLLKPLELIRLMSTGPADLMNLPAGRLAVGQPADVTVIDPNAEWQVEPMKFLSKSRNTPFKGMTLKGQAQMVLVGGQVVLDTLRQPQPA